ncbi:formyltetrahydrofolate deformylase [Paenibacillus polymyxa]|mgnify:CR=1 FL=1|jgi:formyltetrahydrofolate deformylase|uniref:formyltetrahydrofolate deformylase n=1 Tax=Paenibacillus TaxID=44249 RepID=UPI00042F2D67|nr:MULTISPECIES: formyltetrahydrofolate deformylase [Paenibacillus]AHM64993.1 formyltetrahydrofolate deformylase (formyl-h(4)f hydrolase) (puru) [Paenibacillus polymyxa SQR-21]AIY10588.1 formyltetrahydrofolate deformylase [Paenibacillus polymyxa]KAE8559628.1 formyltetrahydrofolate deformylase [Paenibacillus polymyxa]KAF6585099.1 formyltetrahydrofolate deformylase [Paenibacillus sp. EKM211P]KAF6619409.1 formyltetrahydrofolate deformylase [Paenibacillus sp. EKM101P]
MEIHVKHQPNSTVSTHENRARMLVSCPDGPGIVATVSRFLYEHGANIVQSDQYTMDPSGGMFFMRIEFDLPNLSAAQSQLEQDFVAVAEQFRMEWTISAVSRKKKLAIFVSKEDHCLVELLWQWQAGDLDADISLVVSNHPDMKEYVESFGIPYHHIPVTADTKPEAERRQLEVIGEEIDVIILARYMQIISPKFIEHYRNRIINIHHSFLPAFVGGKPYAQAYNRGVKIIGATAHYVTEELDGGPIIEQDVQRVSHGDDVNELKRIGRTIERVVLARAVKWHTEDRILVHENKTVVFN